MQIAKSLVMKPPSMVSMHTASSASQKVFSSTLLSSFARCSRPRVQAKMEAVKCKDSRLIQPYYVIQKYVYLFCRDMHDLRPMGLVEVSFPSWCCL